MNSRVEGVIDSITTRVQPTRFGDKNIFVASVGGVVVETGFKKQGEEGALVKWEVEFNYKKWNFVRDAVDESLPLVGAEGATHSGPVGRPSSGGSTVKGSGGFPVDQTSGQMSIIRQNSFNRAVELVENMTARGSMPIPTTEEEYLDKVFAIAVTVTDFNSGQDLARALAEVED